MSHETCFWIVTDLMVTKRSVVTTIFTLDLKVKSLAAPDWGWVFEHPSTTFFRDIAKTAARSAAAFDTAIQTTFSHVL